MVYVTSGAKDLLQWFTFILGVLYSDTARIIKIYDVS
jgi:hypothetical protein